MALTAVNPLPSVNANNVHAMVEDATKNAFLLAFDLATRFEALAKEASNIATIQTLPAGVQQSLKASAQRLGSMSLEVETLLKRVSKESRNCRA